MKKEEELYLWERYGHLSPPQVYLKMAYYALLGLVMAVVFLSLFQLFLDGEILLEVLALALVVAVPIWAILIPWKLSRINRVKKKYGQSMLLGGIASKDEFIKGIAGGTMKPASVKQTTDSNGPLMIFDFPDLKCQIHTHFNDEEYEAVGRSHIKSYDGKEEEIDYLDNFTVAMLRHHVEIDEQ